MIRLGVGHAFTPQERGHYGGSDHAVVTSGNLGGRLQRTEGDALCKPRSKFWGLSDYGAGDLAPVTCKRCTELATRLVLSGDARFGWGER